MNKNLLCYAFVGNFYDGFKYEKNISPFILLSFLNCFIFKYHLNLKNKN